MINDNYFCRRIASPDLLPGEHRCLRIPATEGRHDVDDQSAHEEPLAAHNRFMRDEWIPAATREAAGLAKADRRNPAATLYGQMGELTGN